MPKRFTKEDFIKKCRSIYGKRYGYDKVEYKNSTTKVCITCFEHGDFYIRPSDFLSGHKCPECAGVKKMTKETFIEKAKNLYGDKYDYSKVEYVNNKTKVCIICHEKDRYNVEHGEFWQRPNDHLSGYECPKCKNEYVPTTEEWVERAKEIHGDKYDYSKVRYINAFTKVCIICPEHGEFWQTPCNHIENNANCPICNSNKKSNMEEHIAELLEKNGIEFERQKTFDWLKYKRHLYLDYYLPKHNIVIEVNGEQHYRPIRKFGGKESFSLQQRRDDVKKTLCEEHGLQMFTITKLNNNIDEIINFVNNGTAN